uniref:Transthyretin domain containing protein n=1 Tax=Haemonchus contortus TaxID=6289 RepID=W6N9D4_HAECO
MNTIIFLALLIPTAYAEIVVPLELKVKGSFHCTYNKDEVTIELWDSGLLDSKNVSVGDSFRLFGVQSMWNLGKPYIIIRHRCNPCNKNTVIQYRLRDIFAYGLSDFGAINLDNLESSRCFKEL